MTDRVTITARHTLLGPDWTTDVHMMAAAVERLKSDRSGPNACEVVFFEVSGDGLLHVNVTHRHRTKTVAGWAGPAVLPAGFLHNRTFGTETPAQIVRNIRDMAFAARL